MNHIQFDIKVYARVFYVQMNYLNGTQTAYKNVNFNRKKPIKYQS